MRTRSSMLVPVSIMLVMTLLSPAILPSTAMKEALAFEADPGAARAPLQANLTDQDFNSYMSYDEMVRYLELLQSKFPDTLMLTSLGTTYDGHNMWAVKISDQVKTRDDQGDTDEPDVLYTGLHHGNEWMSAAFVLYFINHLMTAYSDPENSNHTKARWLIDTRELWFVPMVNPDAYVYNGDGDFGNKTNWRKNREPNYTPNTDTALPESAWGTDLNRNYQFHWGDEINEDDLGDGLGSSFSPTSSVYRGPNDDKDDDGDSILGIETWDPIFGREDKDGVDEDPVDLIDNDGDGKIDEDPDGGFSSAETLAVKKLVEQNDFVFSLSYHTYSELVIYPWGWTSTPCDEEYLFQKVGGVLANLTDYTLVNGWDFYRTTGDSDDWMYAIHGVYAMTIELCTSADGGHNARPDMIVPTGERNVRAAEYVAEVADNPLGNYLHIIHDPLGNTTDFENDYEVVAKIADPDGTGGVGRDYDFNRPQMYLHYRLNDGSFHRVLMEKVSGAGETYLGLIPASERGTEISYYIEARDVRKINVTAPRFAPYDAYTFKVLMPEEPGVGTRIALVISMLFFFSVTWGSFIFCIVIAIRAERSKFGGAA